MADLYPENALEAYRGSVALGVDVVEIDCWLTGDGTLVCLHDSTVDRTTTGSGLTHDLESATATALRVDAGAGQAIVDQLLRIGLLDTAIVQPGSTDVVW